MHLRQILIITLLTCLLSSVCQAGEIASVRISKVLLSSEAAKIYFDMLDSQGHQEQNTIPNNFTTLIGAQKAVIQDVRPFSLSDEGIAYVLVLDFSSSLPNEDFTKIKQMLSNLLHKMSATDKILLISGKEAAQGFSANKEDISNSLSSATLGTVSASPVEQLNVAEKLITKEEQDLPARKVIIMLTDREQAVPPEITKQQAIEHLLAARIPLYVISYAKQAAAYSGAASDSLGDLARISGGAYYQSKLTEQEIMYNDILKASKAGFIAYVTHSPLNTADSQQAIPLQLSFGVADKLFTDVIAVKVDPYLNLPVPSRPKKTTYYGDQRILYLGGIALLGILLMIVISLWSKRRASSPPKAREALTSAPVAATMMPEPTPTQNFFSSQTPEADTASPKCLHIRLTMLKNPADTCAFSLTDTLIIGSSIKYSHLVLADQTIADKHCKLSAESTKLFLTNLTDNSQTLVNGIPITQRLQLHDGDVLSLGQTEMRVTF